MPIAIQGIAYAILVAASAAGAGSALAKWLRISPNLGERGILGLFCFGLINCAAHFFVPLGLPEQIVVLAAGLGLLAIFGRSFESEHVSTLVLAVSILVVLSVHALREDLGYDAGLYYLQNLKWNREFPITIGLANLHGRFGFNSFYFLIAGVTNNPLFAWIPNAAAAAFFGAACLQRAGLRNPVYVVLALAVFALTSAPGTFRPDELVRALIVYWTAIAIDYLATRERQETNAALLLILASLAMLVKVSAAPLMIATVLVLLISRRGASAWHGRAIAFTAVGIGLWVLRGVLLSGCALYPSPHSCITALPWTVAPEQALWHQMAIRSWARAPWVYDFGLVMSNYDWFRPWLHETIRIPIVLLAAAGLAVCLATAAYERIVHRRSIGPALFLTVLLCGCLLWWFVLAPDLRFASGYLVSLTLLGFSVPAGLWLTSPAFWKAVRIGIVSLAVLRCGLPLVQRHSTIPDIPVASVYQVQLNDGNGVWIPRQGDKCWDHPLPCTAYFHPEWWSRIRWRSHWPASADPAVKPPPGWAPIQAEDSRLKAWQINQPE